MWRAALTKEWTLLLRDRGALASMFLLPVVFMVAFGAIFRFGPDDDNRPKPALELQCEGTMCPAVRRALEIGFEVRAVPSASQAPASVDETPRLRVPDGFTGHNGMTAELLLPENLASRLRGPYEYGVRLAMIQFAAGDRLAQELVRVTVAGAVHAVPTSFQVTVPGNGVLFGFFLALTVALSFVEERKTGVWRRHLASPVPLWQAMLAKLVPFLLVGLLQFTFFFGLAAWVFHMPVAGSVPGLALVCIGVTTCAVALGFFLASLGGSEKQLGSLGSIGLLVMALLGGCMVPRFAMPEFMKQLGLAVPHGWALDGFHAIIVDGAGVGEVLKPVAILVGLAALLATAAAFRMRRGLR